MRHHTEVLDRVVGHEQAMLAFKIVPCPTGQLNSAIENSDVFRVDSSTDSLDRQGWVKLKNAAQLV
jgi:hypothetical protein